MRERGFFKQLSSDDGMCRLYSRKGGPISLKWGEGERDGTFDREEGLADTSGSHRGVSGKNGFFVILCLECIQYEYTHTHCTAYWMLYDTMPEMVDALLTLIFRMWQRVCHLPLLQ